jgi:geranylgeranyl pyrophosphate synthase
MQYGLNSVESIIRRSISETSVRDIADELSAAFLGGKMLRGKLVLKMGEAMAVTPASMIHRTAAAIEMIHAASLLHDDVVDGGILRRGLPAFWRRKGIAGAILLGDLMVCRALSLLTGDASASHISALLVKLTGEMCDSEASQELVLDADDGGFEESVLLARRKTGSLFAFAASAVAEPGSPLAKALLEAGYRLGTAYQLADDVLDSNDGAALDGKDLGKDALSHKLTAVSAKDSTRAMVISRIASLITESYRLLEEWPVVKAAWKEYLLAEFKPVIDIFIKEDCEVTIW